MLGLQVGLSQTGGVLIRDVEVHVGDGTKHPKASIGFRNGRIDFISSDAKDVSKVLDTYQEILDGKGKHLYPGFIALNSRLGLAEIGSVRATRDFAEVGSFNPNVRSLIAYNTDSKIIPVTRSNGILMTQVAPISGYLSGSSSVFKLQGKNWEDAVYLKDDGLFLEWPLRYTQTGWWAQKGDLKINKKYREEVGEIVDFFETSYAYTRLKNQKEKDLRYESLRNIFSKKQKLYIRANSSEQIRDAIDFMNHFKLTKNAVIVGGYETFRVLDLIKEYKIPIILGSIQALPKYEDDDYDQNYKNAKILHEEGIAFALELSSRSDPSNLRNLPFQAGQAVAFGLPYEEGVKSITLSAAKMLGIDKTTGSITLSKDATMFLSEGDALDIQGNQVFRAWIQGENVDLNTMQKRLYRKFTRTISE